MRIAYVSDAVYPYNKGGKEMRLWELTRRLVKRGHEVDVYTMKWWDEDAKVVEHEGVRYHAICPYIPLYSGQRRSISQGILYALSCIKLLVCRYEVVDVDHMPFFPLYTMRLVTWLQGKRMYATWHEVWGRKYWVEYMGILGNLAWLVEWGSMWLPDKVIANSRMTQRNYLEINNAKDVVLAPLGIDFDAIQSIKEDKKAAEVLFVGRLLEHKHGDVLIDVMRLVHEEMPKVRCEIIGEGPEYESLKKQIQRLGLDGVISLNNAMTDHEQVLAKMKGANVLVLPSTREGFGLVVLEALACGLPVITTNSETNAAKDLIGKDLGSVVELDAEVIAAEIVRYLKGKNSGRKRRIEEARRYDWERFVDTIFKVY